MNRQTLRVFSNVTPIQSAAITTVDLGNTSHCLTVVRPQQPGGDGSRCQTADVSKLQVGPILDLRKVPKSRQSLEGGSLKVGLRREDTSKPSCKAVCDDKDILSKSVVLTALKVQKLPHSTPSNRPKVCVRFW